MRHYTLWKPSLVVCDISMIYTSKQMYDKSEWYSQLFLDGKAVR